MSIIPGVRDTPLGGRYGSQAVKQHFNMKELLVRHQLHIFKRTMKMLLYAKYQVRLFEKFIAHWNVGPSSWQFTIATTLSHHLPIYQSPCPLKVSSVIMKTALVPVISVRNRNNARMTLIVHTMASIMISSI